MVKFQNNIYEATFVDELCCKVARLRSQFQKKEDRCKGLVQAAFTTSRVASSRVTIALNTL